VTSDQSLRERKKIATREAMSRAAWDLMVEHGIDAVTAEAVAESAGVSPRTFRNYFRSPEEALLDAVIRRSSAIVGALRARPLDEPVWESFLQVLPDMITTIVGRREDVAVLLQARADHPALLGEHLAAFERMNTDMVETVAERTGTDPRRDLTPHLLAGAAASVLQTSTEMWGLGNTEPDLAELVRAGLIQLRAGIPAGDAVPPPAGRPPA
jgi:AcrR family transcriptional regulator